MCVLNYSFQLVFTVRRNISNYPIKDILQNEKPDDCSTTLFHNYLQTVIGYFYLSTHDLRLLKHVIKENFETYAKPVTEGTVSENSVVLLWRKIEPTFRVARASLFLKSRSGENQHTLGKFLIRNRMVRTGNL